MRIGAAYIRVSTERQDEFSPDSQLKLVRTEAEKRDTIIPDEYVFYDDGISGRSAEKRPEFVRMIGMAKSKDKPFDVIFVWKFSRFARNQEESIVYKSLLNRNGVDVVSVSEPLLEGPFGTLIERIIEWMDEYYSIRLSGEVKRGMTERAKRGLPNAIASVGYRMQSGEYVVHPEEAEIVRRIFTEFASGKKVYSIVRDLREEGITKENGNPISSAGALYILNNPVYLGKTRWSQNGKRRSASSNDLIVADGKHEAIIDPVTWDKVQAELKRLAVTQPKYAHSRGGRQHMLRSLLKCSNCGSTMVLYNGGKGFNCGSYTRGSCGASHYISTYKITDMVLRQLAEDAESFRARAELTAESGKKEVINYDKLIAKEQAKIQRVREAYQAGIDSIAEYRAARQAIEDKIEEYRQKQVEQDRPRENRLRGQATVITEALKLLRDPDIAEETKNEIMKSIVKKIVFDRSTTSIEIFYQD